MTRVATETENFAALLKDCPTIDAESWTESDTRSKLIDRLFVDCLGWNERDIRRELSKDKQRLDYLFHTTVGMLVVEAKKYGVQFPLIKRPKRRVRIESLIAANPGLQEPIQQAAGYAHTYGIEYACVTNGRTFIVFQASRTDGRPWAESDCICFADIFDSKTNHAELYACLSRTSVGNGELGHEINQQRPTECHSILSRYLEPDITIPKNEVGVALEPLLGKLFTGTEIDSDSEFLRRCYVLPPEGSLQDPNVEQPLIDLPPTRDPSTISIHNRNTFEQFRKAVQNAFDDVASSRLLLVVGDVGVGKTIFLKRFFSVELCASDLATSTVVCHVDFRSITPESTNVGEMVLARVGEFFDRMDERFAAGGTKPRVDSTDLSSKSVLEQVFKYELAQFKRLRVSATDGQVEDELSALKKDAKLFVRRIIEYFKSEHKWNFCLVIDNADHHDEAFQRRVYQVARELECSIGCTIIITLQEQWFWQHSASDGVLSAYQDTVFHIPAPQVRYVIGKRLRYAIEECHANRIRVRGFGMGTNINVEVKHLESFMRACEASFFEKSETSMALECISCGDARRGLAVFCDFVRSGHTKAIEYMKAILANMPFAFTVGEVMNSIIKSQHKHYSGFRSYVPNPFVVPGSARTDQTPRFLVLHLLQELDGCYKGAVPGVGRGFAPRKNLEAMMFQSGLVTPDYGEILAGLCRRRLIAPDAYSAKRPAGANYYRQTAMGRYVLQQAVFNSVFVEACMLDTPICDVPKRTYIADRYSDGAVVLDEKLRREAMKCFLEELDAHEQRENHTLLVAGRKVEAIVPQMRKRLWG